MSTAPVCDTSVLLPALVAWHPEHESSRAALGEGVEAVPVHVLLECYSVLTRLPSPHRVAAGDAAEVLAHLELAPLDLPAHAQASLVQSVASANLRGGAVYDALVAATARHHGRRLITRDRRARDTYEQMGVDYTLL